MHKKSKYKYSWIHPQTFPPISELCHRGGNTRSYITYVWCIIQLFCHSSLLLPIPGMICDAVLRKDFVVKLYSNIVTHSKKKFTL